MNTETTPAPLEIVTDSPAELVAVIKESGLEPVSAQSLLLAFKPSFLAATKLIDDAKAVVVTDATMVTEIKRARALRLDLKKVRVEAEKLKDKLRENSKREANAILGVWNLVKLHIEPVEQRLQEAEDFAVRAEAERKEKLKTERIALIKPFSDPTFYQLGDMPQESFDKLLDGLKAAALAAQQAKEKAEAERIAKEQAEIAERERIRLENERLRKEAEEREAAALLERQKAEAAAAQARAEREAAEAAAAKAKTEAEELLAKERAAASEALRVAEENARLARETAAKEAARLKAEADAKLTEERRQAEAAAAKLKAEADAKLAEERRLADEAAAAERARVAQEKAVLEAKARADREAVEAKAKIERDAAEAKARQERAEAEKARFEAAAKAEKEKAELEAAAKAERAERMRLEAEAQSRESARLAEIEVERAAKEKAASAPDKDRLLTFANAIRAIELPEFSTDIAKSLAKVVESQRGKFLAWIEEKAGGL